MLYKITNSFYIDFDDIQVVSVSNDNEVIIRLKGSGREICITMTPEILKKFLMKLDEFVGDQHWLNV